MTINLSMPTTTEMKPRIIVLGVGGAGGNAVNNMISSKLEGVEFVVANTDAQAISQSLSERHIQLGADITQGLGAGARPEVGRASAEETIESIVAELQGCHMAFVTAGMGGGTGTGAAPVVARAARDLGILTIGVVTKPFQFEGTHRMEIAERGIEELQQYVDTLIVIPNQNLFRVANEKTTFADAFKMADDVLYSGVRGVTDLMVMPGLINLDFADVRTVMSEMGKAMMGTGEAEGEARALDAAEAAITNPLLDDVSMKGARGVLINITGGMDLTLFEVDEAANRIRNEVDPDANIIVGSTFDERLDGSMRVSVVATGINAVQQVQPQPQSLTGYPQSVRPTLVVSDRDDETVEEEREEVAAEQVAVAQAVEHQAASAGQIETNDSQPLELGPKEEVGAPQVAIGRGHEAPFIAPPPVVPAPQPDARRFGGARAMANPQPTVQTEVKKSGVASLFNRMADSMRGQRVPVSGELPVQAPAEPPAARPQEGPVRRTEPEFNAPRPAAARPVTEVAPKREEDVLDIPAFLRRQAN